MSLSDLQRNWNGLAQEDAFRAVLTSGGHVPWDRETFFRTGIEEIGGVLARVRAAGITHAMTRALDFGCGLGRLTQALARHFDRVDGVDIAENMLTQARALNPFGDRCEWHLNDRDDLSLFPDSAFDLVYSNITLQHMEPHYSRRYIEEFFRVVRPGGAVMFQIPGEAAAVGGNDRYTRSAAILPKRGLRAAIEPHPPVRCAPGALLLMHLTVRNISTELWPAQGNDDGTLSIRLGNHWRSRFGRMLREDDVRARLPHDVAPGESVGILLKVEAPRKPGVYRLEFDMVQEHVQWFAAAGSQTRRTRVHSRCPHERRPGGRAAAADGDVRDFARRGGGADRARRRHPARRGRERRARTGVDQLLVHRDAIGNDRQRPGPWGRDISEACAR